MAERMLQFVRLQQAQPEKRKAAQRTGDFGEIYREFVAEAASAQASRCSQCGVPFCSVHCPLNNETMYLLLVMQEPGKPRLAQEDLPRLLKERLAPFGGRIGEIRETVDFDAAQIVYRPLEVVFVSEPWYRGRILLIGDAAHGTTPHLGQGAAQAVEDAATLGALAAQHLPVSELFARFMAKRYDRCKFIWESSIQIGKWEMANDPEADVAALSHKVLQTVSAPL